MLDIPRTTLGDYEREKTEPNIDMLIRMSDSLDVDLGSLLTRDLSLDDYQVAKTADLRILAISVDQDNEGNIELVETKAEAGYLDSYSNPEYIRDLPKLRFPNIGPGTYRGFEISGDSMLPVESGSIIICSYVENLRDVKEDKTYIIISKKEGLVYKRVRVDKKINALILISDNPFYLPYEIAFEDVDELWQYYAHLSFNDAPASHEDKFETQLAELNRKLSDIHSTLVRRDQ